MASTGGKSAAPAQLVEKVSQSSQTFVCEKSPIIFCRGMYLAENTYQAASVEFVRQRRTNYARSRLQKFV